MRASVILAFVAAISPAWAQSGAALSTWEVFLREVSARGTDGQPVLQNGQPTQSVLAKPQEVLGLDDLAWSRLKAVADDCAARSKVFDDAVRPLTFDLRIAVTADEDTSRLRQRINAIEQQRRRMLDQQLQRLRNEPTFAELERFVLEHGPQRPFFPMQTGVTARPSPKKESRPR